MRKGISHLIQEKKKGLKVKAVTAWIITVIISAEKWKYIMKVKRKRIKA
jgi:hypothetical protein